MKKIIFLMLGVLALVSCKEDEAPYYGYAVFDNNKNESRIIIDQAEGTATVTLNTDRSNGTVVPQEGSEWCSGSVDNGVLNLHYTANTEESTRVGVVNVVLGLHRLTLQVIQRSNGINHVEILNPDEGDEMRWSATCSDVQIGDGGGVDAIFDNSQTNFWHSNYSDPAPLPHWIIVDLKEEMEVNQVRLGWRMYGSNVYMHVRKVEILYSTDGTNFMPTGGEILREPVDGKLTSPNYPPYTDCAFETVKARYIKLNMTESNSSNGVCHLGYFKVFMP